VAGAAVTGVSGSGTTYTVSVNTGSGSGTLRLDVIDDDSIVDAVLNPLGGPGLGNGNFTTGETYTIDKTAPSVSSSVRADPNPTNAASVDFTVTFSKAVTGVDTSDFGLTTTGVSGASITGVTGSGTTYTVSVNTGSGSGTLRLDVIDDDSIVDAVLNPLGGPGLGNGNFTTGETYTIDRTGPVVVFGVNTVPANNAVLTTGPTQITVEFSKDVKNDASAGAANNTANYLLVEAGVDGTFDTMTCAGGLVADDTPIAVNSAAYNNSGGAGPFVATLNLNGGAPLPPGNYRLLICGTTSIEDLLGNELNDGASDTRLDFTVGRTAAMPSTGFAPGHVTLLPDRPSNTAYAAMSGLWLDIPKIGVRGMAIVGVPLTADGWDVTWLGNDAGWLNGTAFPTWAGNSAITGHVWDAYNRPGPFADLNQLVWGDRVIITAGGVEFVYEVRSVQAVPPNSTGLITRHEELSWLTLITCRSYDPDGGEYARRLVVRAVLVDTR
jgi:LPXTG-site transpeptidase (sortase) family protein